MANTADSFKVLILPSFLQTHKFELQQLYMYNASIMVQN